MSATISPEVEGSERHDQLRFACARCRLRKIKCDRQVPCSTCKMAHTDCRPLEPRPRKIRAKTRVTPVVDSSRLQRLEGLVQRLMASKDPQREASEIQSPPTGGEHEDAGAGEHDFAGRVVTENSRRRYVTSDLWLELLDLLGEQEDEDHDDESQDPMFGDSTHSYLTDADVVSFRPPLYPLAAHLSTIWRAFMLYVDPALKVIHCPSFGFRFLSFGQARLRPAEEALCYALCFATFMSSDDMECRANYGEPRDDLLRNYRSAIDEALKKAHLVDRPELTTLQAFVIYLCCLSGLGHSQQAWSLNGLASRLGRSLGVHESGEKIGLSVFEAEMRRRLWWQICLLDHRALANAGTESFSDSGQFVAQIPANINDEDISEASLVLPASVRGITNTSVTISRCFIHLCLTKVGSIHENCRKQHASHLCDACRSKINVEIAEYERYVDENYLAYLSPAIPFHEFLRTVTHLIDRKLKRGICQASDDMQTRLDLFEMDLDIIQTTTSLYSSPVGRKWVWCYGSYVQWRAIASVLKEVQRGDLTRDLIDRVCNHVDGLFLVYQNMPLDRPSRSILSALSSLRASIDAQHSRQNGAVMMDPLHTFDALDLDSEVLTALEDSTQLVPDMQDFFQFDWLAAGV